MNGSEQNQAEQNGTTSNEVEQEPSLSELWEQAEPGSRVSKGVYSVWKAPDGALVLAYRVEGAEEDQVMPIPASMVRMAFSAMDGRGPLGHLKNLAERQAARYLE